MFQVFVGDEGVAMREGGTCGSGSEAEAIVCCCLADPVDSLLCFMLFPIYSTLWCLLLTRPSPPDSLRRPSNAQKLNNQMGCVLLFLGWCSNHQNLKLNTWMECVLPILVWCSNNHGNEIMSCTKYRKYLKIGFCTCCFIQTCTLPSTTNTTYWTSPAIYNHGKCFLLAIASQSNTLYSLLRNIIKSMTVSHATGAIVVSGWVVGKVWFWVSWLTFAKPGDWVLVLRDNGVWRKGGIYKRRVDEVSRSNVIRNILCEHLICRRSKWWYCSTAYSRREVH